MCHDHNVFIQAVNERRKIIVTYLNEEDNFVKSGHLVPMDCSCDYVGKEYFDCYQFWDYQKGFDSFPVVLSSEQILNIKFDEESFDPAEFVTWDLSQLPWCLKRDWGLFS